MTFNYYNNSDQKLTESKDQDKLNSELLGPTESKVHDSNRAPLYHCYKRYKRRDLDGYRRR